MDSATTLGASIPLVDRVHESCVRSRRVEVLSAEIARLLPHKPGLRLLDIGCGDGQILNAVSAQHPGMEGIGVDTLVRPGAVRRVVSYDGKKVPFEDRSFDVVLLVDVLHHADDPLALLAEASRVCAGSLILKDHLLEGFMAGPTLAFMDRVGNRRFGVELPYRYLRREEWLSAFSELGLRIDQWTDRLGLYPFPANLWFDRKLHFVCRLSRASEPAAQVEALAPGETEVSVVLPCLNEAATLAECVSKARGFLARAGITGEIVVADNGSTDGSVEIARRSGAVVAEVKERGYGAALFHGTLRARGRYVIMGDADGSYDFSRLDGFVEKLRAGSDFVIGNRFKGGILADAMPWKNRYIGNPVLSWIGRRFYGVSIGDFHCGLRAYRKRAFLDLGLVTNGMEMASEMIVKAALRGARITEVPTTLSPDGRGRPPHLRPWRDGWRHLRFLLMFSPHWLFFVPGSAVALAAGAMVARLAFGNIRIAGVELAEHTLLFCGMLLVVGVQAMFFSIFGEAFYGRMGIYPMRRGLQEFLKRWRVEYGILAAGGLMLAGALGAFHAFGSWANLHFAGLTGFQVMRLSILSVITLVLGSTILMNSFYLGILDFRVRPGEGVPDNDR